MRFNLLYLLRNSGEHFASTGIQIKHLLDWAFFVQSNTIDWSWLLQTLDRVGMQSYLAVLNVICTRYLVFSSILFPELLVDDALVTRSLNDILFPEVEREHKKTLLSE